MSQACSHFPVFCLSPTQPVVKPVRGIPPHRCVHKPNEKRHQISEASALVSAGSHLQRLPSSAAGKWWQVHFKRVNVSYGGVEGIERKPESDSLTAACAWWATSTGVASSSLNDIMTNCSPQVGTWPTCAPIIYQLLSSISRAFISSNLPTQSKL